MVLRWFELYLRLPTIYDLNKYIDLHIQTLIWVLNGVTGLGY